jgi:hypothetical protein
MSETLIIYNYQSTPQLLFKYSLGTAISVYSIIIERHNDFKQIYQQLLNIELQPDGEIILGGLNINNDTSYEICGITFSKITTNEFIEIYYTSTNTGYNGTFTYTTLV